MKDSTTIKSGVSLPKKAGPGAVSPRFSKNTKVVAGAGAVILLLAGLVIAAMPKPAANIPATVEPRSTGSAGSAGTLMALATKFNFGSVSMARGKVTHRYLIRNTGTEPLLIRKMYTSCMCTTAALVKGGQKSDPYGMPGHGFIPTINERMNPGEDAIIEVVFDPAAHGPAGIGPVDRVVTIENTAGRPLVLALAATVTP
ncbi:MAG TPA: DUF1573 domain-containing protein [Candidatus Binatia bacterium]